MTEKTSTDAELEAQGYYRDERGAVLPLKYRPEHNPAILERLTEMPDYDDEYVCPGCEGSGTNADTASRCLMCGGLGALDQSTPEQTPTPGAAVGHPTIVCLCGSGRFREAFDAAEFRETLAGKIVLTIGCNTKDIARDVEWEHVKPMLDELHLRKIDLADEVLILNCEGYIGESTRRELAYAITSGKTIRYLEPHAELLPDATPPPEASDGYGETP